MDIGGHSVETDPIVLLWIAGSTATIFFTAMAVDTYHQRWRRLRHLLRRRPSLLEQASFTDWYRQMRHEWSQAKEAFRFYQRRKPERERPMNGISGIEIKILPGRLQAEREHPEQNPAVSA